MKKIRLDSKIRTCARHYSMLVIPNHTRFTGLLHIQKYSQGQMYNLKARI